jgi:hypothetical protein
MRRLKPFKTNSLARSKGQAMIEYVVITGVLVAALLTGLQDDDAGYAKDEGYIGLSKNDEGSLVQALHKRYTAQAYALSLPEPPELNSLEDLSIYYDSLGKFPELSKKILQAGTFMNKLTSGLDAVNDGLDKLEEYTDPKKAKEILDPSTLKDKLKKELKEKVKDEITNISII